MTAIVETLWRSRLKGAKGQNRPYITINPIFGAMNDRQYAIRSTQGDMGSWAAKAAFYVCMNTARMAVEDPIFVVHDESLQIDQTYLLELAERLGIQGEIEVQNARGAYSLHDTKGAYVSFLNLASVDALSEFMGVTVDPHRFRMNVWMRGLEPFEELTWVDRYPGTREIVAGECRLRVDDACERCKAPEANPSTGQYDLEIQKALDDLMSNRGYKSPHRGTPRVMGFLAAPLQSGHIQIGDKVRLV